MIKLILAAILLLHIGKTQPVVSYLYMASTHRYDDTLRCYVQQKGIKGSLLMSLGIYQLDYVWGDSSNKTDPKQVYEMYPEPVHIHLVTLSNFDHSLFGQLVARAVKDQPIKAVWVYVYSNIESCSQLKGFLRDIKNAVGPDTTVGIDTTPEEWNYKVNTGEGCSEVALQYPLFYSKDHFYPFSGWKKAEYNLNSRKSLQQCQRPETFDQILYFTKQ